MAPRLTIQLGLTIARLRKRAGFSQEAFAAHAGFHRVYMGNIEQGKKDLRLSTLERIAEALGMSAGELLRAAERKRPKGT
jgi:transcriptional regulator with XRE-family HTH domain